MHTVPLLALYAHTYGTPESENPAKLEKFVSHWYMNFCVNPLPPGLIWWMHTVPSLDRYAQTYGTPASENPAKLEKFVSQRPGCGISRLPRIEMFGGTPYNKVPSRGSSRTFSVDPRKIRGNRCD